MPHVKANALFASVNVIKIPGTVHAFGAALVEAGKL
jgi:hypothetical protein